MRGAARRERLVLAAAALGACYLAALVGEALRAPGRYPLGDFFALWSGGVIAAGGAAGAFYDPAALFALQTGLGSQHGSVMPHPYPPHAALLLLPLGGLGYWAAAAVWLGGGFALYAASVLGGQARWRGMALALVLAPTTTINLAYGQGGFLVAALLIGGLRLAGTRPIAAGLLFGLLTFKPQFGMLVPVALAAAGHWRCMGAAAAAACALAGAATAWQGTGVWAAWLAYLPDYSAWFAERAAGIMPTVEAGLEMLGAPAWAARTGQAAAAVAGAACTWRWWRTGRDGRVPVALAATALATPHALIYDLPLLTGGVVLFAAQRWGALRWRWAALAAVLAFPVALNVRAWELPLGGPMLVTALAVFTWRQPENGRERDNAAGTGQSSFQHVAHGA